MLRDFINKKIEDIRILFEQKHKQYGDVDELDNFRIGAFMNYGKAGFPEMFEEAKAYQRKHIAFIEGHPITANKINESLMDIAIYSLIMLYMWENYRKETETTKQAPHPNIYYEKIKYENLCRELEEEIAIKDAIIHKLNIMLSKKEEGNA